MRELFARLFDWLRRDRLDAELTDELQFHARHLERDAQAGGKDANAATGIARRQLGNVMRVREEARDRWSVPWLDHIQQDVRYAFRGLRRSPGFTAAVVLTLGLGIGANAAMFNVIDQLMLRPFAYLREPAQVQRVYLRLEGADRLLSTESFPYTRYLDLAKWTTSFSQHAGFFPTTVAVGTGAASRERPIAAVTASYFDFFDARPILGRFFIPSEDTPPAGANVAVLSFAFWEAEFGRRNVIGESIQVDNVICTIVGVAPKGFTGISERSAPVLFMPITTFGAHQPGGSSVGFWVNYTWDWTEMMVRVKPGITPSRANADLTQAYLKSRDAARRVHSWMPRTDVRTPVAVAGALKTAAGPYPGLEARTLVWVTGVAAIVLLIACANVANLFLSRTLRRRREIALRLALGVTRRRLIAQSLTESLVLSLLGCALGIAMAQWGGLVLRRLVLPGDTAIGVVTDWRTLGVAVAAAVVAGIVTGFAPVLLAEHGDIINALKGGVREGTHQRSRVRSSLLVMQVVLSVLLLVGAGLFVQSLAHVSRVHLGYNVNPVLLARWNRRGEQVATNERAMIRRRVLDVARTIPGVERAAWASNVPIQGTSTMSIFVPGIDSVGRLGRFTYQSASTDYFETIGTRILRGRPFSAADALGSPTVTVVSAAMARVLWPGQDALGQCIRVGADSMPCTRVVGVAEDAVHDPVKDQPLRYYLPMEQFPNEGGSLLVLRMAGSPAAQAENVRRALQAVMPGQQYITVQPLDDLLGDQRRSWRLGATMFVAFGVLALVVAAVGLYGVIAYNVGQRMHELGVRRALGAQAGDVVRLVMSQGVRLSLVGIGVGSLVALAAARFVEPLLFQQSATDPVVYAIVGSLLLVVAIVACSVPAAKAMRADPNTVLRAE